MISTLKPSASTKSRRSIDDNDDVDEDGNNGDSDDDNNDDDYDDFLIARVTTRLQPFSMATCLLEKLCIHSL